MMNGNMIWLVPMALLAVMQLSGGLCRGAPGETMHVRTQFCATVRRAVPEAPRPRPVLTALFRYTLCKLLVPLFLFSIHPAVSHPA
ncbi:hypothetical protein B0H11DRAFT_1275773 [Mycena galericulata]|nr:hypothetical protein B0H11DRAFT_1275773 [Mycena galericulata]